MQYTLSMQKNPGTNRPEKNIPVSKTSRNKRALEQSLQGLNVLLQIIQGLKRPETQHLRAQSIPGQKVQNLKCPWIKHDRGVKTSWENTPKG